MSKEPQQHQQLREVWALLSVAMIAAACSSPAATTPPPDAGSGGRNSQGGTSGNTGGSAAMGGGAGGASSGGAGGSGGGAAGTGGTGTSLDQCFMGLRPLVGVTQVATKDSADGMTRVRLALETADRGGTSGTQPWAMLRFAIERPGMNACVTDGAQLQYTGSHHNCTDRAVVTAGTVRYEIDAPDRMSATVSAFMGTTLLWGPVTVMNSACISNFQCRSGGPCN